MYLINGRFIIFLGVLCYLVGRGIFIGVTHKKNNPLNWIKEAINFLFVLYLLMVVSVTLFPLALWIDFNFEQIKYGLNLIPLISIIKDFSKIGIAYDGDSAFMIGLIIRNVGGNILLLMPLGVLAPFISKKFKPMKKSVLLALLVSISIEFIQFIELLAGGRGRTVDVDDVICNVIGASLGYLIYKIMYRLIVKYQIKFLQNLDSEKLIM
ncbi:VanZ family protein [Neobacillus novalis]|uniref:VanZ family protein n=1 Tax=Neobacillus novalis TaxID=220687 RepID=UPI0008242B38|nr:VanZ family protein [Neobacillus novalis]